MPATNPEDLIQELKRTLKLLEDRDNYQALYDAARSDEQRQQLYWTVTAARDAYWSAVDRGLKDTNQFVIGLLDELTSTNKKLGKMLTGLQGFAAAIKLATEAVKLAAAIATLAATG